jgi:hypothetical protein
MKACNVCGRIIDRGSRCAEHAIPARGRAHRVASLQTRAEERTCWICGKPGTTNDPLTADHIVPRAHGGHDTRANMRAAHRSCNQRRGTGVAKIAKPFNAALTAQSSDFPLRTSGDQVAQCYACRHALPIDDFAVDRTKSSGRKSICRRCDRVKSLRITRLTESGSSRRYDRGRTRRR